MKKIASIMCILAMLVVLAGCSDSGAVKGLIGTWRTSGGGIEITFYEDGTYAYTNIGNFTNYATWEAEGDQLTIDGGDPVTFRIEGNRLILTDGNVTDTLYK